MRLSILGTTGYTGALLLKLAIAHPNIKKIYAFSSSRNGEKIEIQSEKLISSTFLSYDKLNEIEFDIIISALPHLTSSLYYSDYIGKKIIIDLAADLRIENKESFVQSYGKLPDIAHYFGKAAYGLSEINYNQIANFDLIANPGCYPTASLLAILPIVKEIKNVRNIFINSFSGVSGAGKKAKTDLLYCERNENINVYNPINKHRHYNEIKEKIDAEINNISLSFNPYLLPINRGIYSNNTILFKSNINEKNIFEIFSQYYKDKSFVKIVPIEEMQMKNVVYTNNCLLSVVINKNQLQIFSAIDNLLKGSAGQAIQNLNLRCGFPETTGLPQSSFA
jgi:N-acetyl-gamma-glutamyl-phosphate reductase